MGSEGRGEQILKTDQDNALLLRDGFEFAGARRGRRSASRPRWPSSAGRPARATSCSPTRSGASRWRRFRDSLRDWVHGYGTQGPMRLAIFLDAAAVAGDASLLDDARAHLDRIVVDSDARLARFAAPADQFAEPGNWWARLTGHLDDLPLDLKKVGTFPIVHGLRALALQHRVHATASAERARLLVDKPPPRPRAGARHRRRAARLHGAAPGAPAAPARRGQRAGQPVVPAELATLERHQLHGALDIVRRFRQFVRGHFRLDSL